MLNIAISQILNCKNIICIKLKKLIDISELPNGCYFTETITNKGKLTNKIIIAK